MKMASELDDEAITRIDSKLAFVFPLVRRCKTSPHYFKDFGFAPECFGCNALRNGIRNPGHNAERKQRFEQHLETATVGRHRLQQSRDMSFIALSWFIEQQDKQQHPQQGASSSSGSCLKRPAIAEGETS